LRGSAGVGGVWPALSYADAAAMDDDSSQAADTFCWLRSTGDTYRYTTGVWTLLTGLGYYFRKAIPRSLRATIFRVEGSTLILSANASADATGANIYLDNAPAFNQARDADSGGDYVFPAGTFAVGSSLDLVSARMAGASIIGAGEDDTTILLPRGVEAHQQALNSIASIIAVYDGADGVTVSDLTIQSNARNQGYMVHVTETVYEGAHAYAGGVFFTNADNGLAERVTCRDVFSYAVGADSSEDCWARNCKAVVTDPLRKYIQWMFMWSSAGSGGAEDCEVDSNYLVAGMAGFFSTGVTFTRPRLRNAVMDLNNVGSWLIDSPEITIEANSLFDAAFSPFNPVINVNTNFGDEHVATGGTIINPIITQEGYVNADNDSLRAIIVNAGNPNITINDGMITAPNYAAPSALSGAIGLLATGVNTNVDGLTVIGSPKPGQANIRVDNGSITDCTAEVIDGP
jgi:hypothetical protein